MARLSMNEMTTYRWSFEQDLKHYKQAGYSAIGVWRQKLSDFGEEKGIELLAESGLTVSNLLWAGGFTGSDGHTFRESLEDAQEAIRLASAMHAGCLVVYTGARAGHTHNHARRLIGDALRELSPLAAEANVTLALEPMHANCGSEWTFLNCLDESLTLIHTLASPRVRLVFDTYHFGHLDGVVERLPEIAEHICIVHLGDSKQAPLHEQNRCPLGEGNLPLREIISALTAAGYDGFYDIELMGEDIEISDYQHLLRHSLEAFEQLTASVDVK